ncbi:hypothetical protein ACLKA7_013968 [Drosophila subpalustris]
MKLAFALALLLSCLTGFLMASETEDALKIMETCMSENGVSSQDLEDLQSGKLKPEDVKDNMKCATQCLFVKFSFMNDKGKLLNDKILEYYQGNPAKPKVEKALAACGNIVGANPCDSAFQIMGCLVKHADEMISL